MRMALNLSDPPPRNAQPQSSHGRKKKKQKKNQSCTVGHKMTHIPQNGHSHQMKGKSEKVSQPRGA